MKFSIQIRRERGQQLSERAVGIQGNPSDPVFDEEVKRHLLRALARFIASCARLAAQVGKLLWIWSVVPIGCALFYIILDRFRFPFPGLGIFVGVVSLTALLHRGSAAPYSATRQGFVLYVLVVLIANRRDIFSDSSFFSQNAADILLLARGETITPSHWLGLFCLAFSSAFFNFRLNGCSRRCPGFCAGSYRQHLHSTCAALDNVRTELSTALACVAEGLLAVIHAVLRDRTHASRVKNPARGVVTVFAAEVVADETAREPKAIEAATETQLFFNNFPRPAAEAVRNVRKPKLETQKTTP